MRPELARRAAQFLVAASGNREIVPLVLFGGEPLLNLAALKAAVTEAEAATRAAGKQLLVSLTTNGTRFTPAVLEFLREHRIDVSISIDGPADVHDANRRFARKNGGGTYADVVAGLKLLRAHALRPPAARVTLTPDQWARIPEVFGHLLGLGFLEVGIAPASPVSAELLPTLEQDEALFAGFSQLAERFAREAAQGRVLPFSITWICSRLHAGQARPRPARRAAISRWTPRAASSSATGSLASSASAWAIWIPESITRRSARASRRRRRPGTRHAAPAGRAACAPAAATTRTICARSNSAFRPVAPAPSSGAGSSSAS
jgi:hypothetical protein